MKPLITQKGFTLIETLVAIAIMMVAIAGPLVVVSKALIAANISKNQMVASYLAQDAIEEIRSLRDNALIDSTVGWNNWLVGTYAYPIITCTASSTCGIQTVPQLVSPTEGTIFSCKSSACTLFTDKVYGYYTTQLINNNVSPFTRSFTVVPYNITVGGASTTDAVLVTVTVGWMEGTTPDSVVYQDVLYNVIR